MTDLRARLDAHLGDRYEVVRELGAGGMATVFLATDTKHGREVALKVLRPEVAGAVGAERFLREIETVARLSHPHILPLHDSGEAGGLLYYVMPYVEGESLRERLEREGALPIEEALQITAECAEALEHAHQEGIIHRDLKPANILFSGGHAVVADFGIGRAVEDAADGEALTGTGISLGTVGYMSPEQASGEKAVDARLDVFALGCVLYEMLTGERAFPGRTAQAVMARQLAGAPPTASVLRRSVPEAVEQVLQRALRPNPADRYGTAAEFRAELAVAQQTDGPRARRAALGLMRRPAVAAVVLLMFGALAYAGFVYARGGTIEPGFPEIRSLAVLPLENHAPDPEAEQYFADGMTEALTAELGQISALTVISRTSASRYRATDKPSPQIAQELGVEGLIEGSVLRAGDEVRITVQLIHGPTDGHLWSESYERDVRDILALQGEVARAVAEQIQVAVSPEEGARLGRAREVDPEAHTLVLEGHYELGKESEAAFRRALELYQQAISVDSTYAPAYAGMAMVYIRLGSWMASLPPRAVHARARAAALKAVELDPNLAEAYIALGRVRHLYEWDWAGADTVFQHGIELNPSATHALQAYGNYLISMGRFGEALGVLRRAVERDPLVAGPYNDVAWALEHLGRDGEALEYNRRSGELGATFFFHFRLAEFYLQRGHLEEAATHTVEAEQALGAQRSPTWVGLLGHHYARVNRTADARRILTELEALAEEEYVPPNVLATIYLGLGQEDKTLDLLEEGYRVRDVTSVFHKIRWLWDPVRDEPRFQEILRQMDFPEE